MNTLSFAFVLATVAAVCSSTEPERIISSSVQDELSSPVQKGLKSPFQYDLRSPVQDDIDSPVQYDIINSPVQDDLSSPVQYIFNVGAAIARNSLLYRAQIMRTPIANVIQHIDHTWQGAEKHVITSVQAYQIEVDQGARVYIIAGGVGMNFVTLRIQSQSGRGLNVMIEIYGR